MSKEIEMSVDHAEPAESSPLIAPPFISQPNIHDDDDDVIDLEAGPEEHIQCRICLESDG